jgi:dTDP-4-amino-4,6-dideoxygalactose transaminase
LTWRIPLADVRLSETQREAAIAVLDSGWLSMGPETAKFEHAFEALSGVKHAVCVSSATAGLILAMVLAGVGPGDEVIVPSLTFVADANAARVLGARPVFADVIRPNRPVVDVEDLLASVSPRTRAAVVVHYGGFLASLEGLSELRNRGITVIEDASHAVGPVNDAGEWIAVNGDFVVFSFFANKNLGVGEGGMIATGDSATAAKLRLLRSHGMTTGTWDRHRGHASDYDVVAPGWNFRPTEMAAALGRAGLADLARLNAARRRVLGYYREAFAATQCVDMAFTATEPTAGHLAVAVLPTGLRSRVREALSAAGIQSSFHYPPIHRFSAYVNDHNRLLPETERAAAQLITLPLHPWLKSEETNEIASVVAASAR